MIYAVAATIFGSTFLFMGLLVVCRGFAAQAEVRETYEHRLWVKYSRADLPEFRKAA